MPSRIGRFQLRYHWPVVRFKAQQRPLDSISIELDKVEPDWIMSPSSLDFPSHASEHADGIDLPLGQSMLVDYFQI